MSAVAWGVCAAMVPGASGGGGRIVFLGDSLTAGYGLAPSEAFPALVQKEMEQAGLTFEVVNAGISGDTTAGGLRRVGWALADGAAVLVIALGGNDGLRGIEPDQTAKNLGAIIDEARRLVPGIRLVLAGMRMPPNMGPEFVKRFEAVYPAVAREKDAVLIPYLLDGVGGVAELNQPDRIHPTAEGQRRIAANVWAVLGPMLGGENN